MPVDQLPVGTDQSAPAPSEPLPVRHDQPPAGQDHFGGPQGQPVSPGQPVSQEPPTRIDPPINSQPAGPDPAFGVRQPPQPQFASQQSLYPAPVNDAASVPAGLSDSAADRVDGSSVTNLSAYSQRGMHEQGTGRQSDPPPAVPGTYSAQVHHLPYRH
ncbi:MAG TPA: hypothetical protein VHF26_07115, partial [Trebonia sp.]|nr:hypothetical protein [Trebonia sp.]